MLSRKFLPIIGSVMSLSTISPICSSYSKFMNYKYLIFDSKNEKQLEEYSKLPAFGGYIYPLDNIDQYLDNKFIYAEDERSLRQVGYSIELENNDTECTIVGIRCQLHQRPIPNFKKISFAIFLLPFRINNKLEKLRIEGKSIFSSERYAEGDPCFDYDSIARLQNIGFHECPGVFNASNGDWEITREQATAYLAQLAYSKLT